MWSWGGGNYSNNEVSTDTMNINRQISMSTMLYGSAMMFGCMVAMVTAFKVAIHFLLILKWSVI